MAERERYGKERRLNRERVWRECRSHPQRSRGVSHSQETEEDYLYWADSWKSLGGSLRPSELVPRGSIMFL